MKAKIITSTECLVSIDETIKNGFKKGYRMPFVCIDDLYSLKLGTTTYIVGHPASGKTEFLFERDIWLSKEYGLTHCIFTPETGRAEEIFIEIGHKWCGQTLEGKYAVDEKTKYRTLSQISNYFHIVEVSDAVTLDEILTLLSNYEKGKGVTINTLTIDPFNELQWDMNGLPRDMWLENTLGKVRRIAREQNKHITIITHPIESDRMYHKDGFSMCPTRNQYAGGQAWGRKGESMFAIWRPPSEGDKFRDEDGIPYQENEMHFVMQKTKPKGTGKLGKGVLYFDWKRSAYYEFIAGNKYYAGEYYKSNEGKQISNFELIEDEPF
jgi:hypothetical protein